MTKQIRLNAFLMNGLPHAAPGFWAHPRDTSHRYTDLEHWTAFARTLEAGKFDGIFLADGLGANDVYRGSAATAIREGIGTPLNDPLQLLPAMASVTEHLGFGITCSISFEHPFPFARRMSTLDHLTKGRAAWNIVTSYQKSGAENVGLKQLMSHDERYDMADEYMEVCYKLWEGSWEDGAVLFDRERRIYADPRKVHNIRHAGKYYSVPGFHRSEPSPQRTPLLYQAGASERGLRFAARHAEAVFTAAPKEELKDYVTELRRTAAEFGRNPSDLIVSNGLMVVVDETDRKAEAKFEEYKRYFNYEATMAMLSGFLGTDLSLFGPNQYVADLKGPAIESFATTVERVSGGKFTLRQLAEWFGMGQSLVGSPATVADKIQDYIEYTDSDGFNLGFIVFPETFEDIIGLLVPELQRRGAYKLDYEPGTLREKLFGGGPRLPAGHPGTAFRELRSPVEAAEATATG